MTYPLQTVGLKVKQIINEDGKFKNCADIRRDMYDTNKIEYYTLCNSIPMPWKRILRMDYREGQLRDNRLDNVLTCKNASQMVYMSWSEMSVHYIPRQDKWVPILNQEMPTEEMHKLCNQAFVVTNSAKLRSFHYKINMHASSKRILIRMWN